MDIYLERVADMVERRTGGIRPTHEELITSELLRSLITGALGCNCDQCGRPLQDEYPIPVESLGHDLPASDQNASGHAAQRKQQKFGKARKHSSQLATVGQLVEPVSTSQTAPGPRAPARACDAELNPSPLGSSAPLASSIPSSCKGARFHAHAPKAKVKTRPAGKVANSSVQDIVNENEELHPVPPSPEKVYMSSTSKEVFARMLATDPSNRSPMHFDEFVAAMADAGFTPKRCGRSVGSAVTFKDTRTNKGSITFHCPHPDPHVDQNKLRTWGTRLSKKFGWELATLVEREK